MVESLGREMCETTDVIIGGTLNKVLVHPLGCLPAYGNGLHATHPLPSQSTELWVYSCRLNPQWTPGNVCMLEAQSRHRWVAICIYITDSEVPELEYAGWCTMYRNALKCPYKAGTFTTNSADSPQIEQNLYTKYWTCSH